MNRRMFLTLLAAAVIAASAADHLRAQQSPGGLWRSVSALSLGQGVQNRVIAGNRYYVTELDATRLEAVLAQAPREFATAGSAGVVLEVPWPDGRIQRFRIEDSPIMEPDLAQQFPELKTYRGQGLDDLTVSVRVDWTPSGFHAMALSSDG